MNCLSKNLQSNENLNLMVKKAFGKECQLKNAELLDGGYCNAIYNIVLEDNSEIILKISNAPEVVMLSYERNLMSNEVSSMRLIKKQTTIVMPEILYYDDSKTICNAPYFFMTKIAGVPLNDVEQTLIDAQKSNIRAKIGDAIRQINNIRGDKFYMPEIPETSSNNNKDFVLSLFRMLLDDGIKTGMDLIHISYDDFWQMLLNNSNYFDDCKEPCFVHWDLWDGNVLVENGEFVGIVDFERCFYGDIMMEDSLSSFGDPHPDYLKATGKTEFSHSEIIRRSIYKLYRILVMHIEDAFRQFNDAGRRDWILGELKNELDNLKKLTVIKE